MAVTAGLFRPLFPGGSRPATEVRDHEWPFQRATLAPPKAQTSSRSAGVSAADTRSTIWFQLVMAVTCAFGLGFLAIEGNEFASLVARGAGPTRSAFLSAFFTLVGCHGLHVSAGILWLLTMMAQVFAKGFRADIQRRILCFALFWHALDIIWIAVFTVVYLLGSAK